ncbi:hypothetical protein JCM19047_2063 [Bacillus sp. JCM 19047]|nr:hypothetical protein JCM19047_2063 [Bacillus sp. JCM 19047]
MFFVREWLFILNELGYNKRERLRPCKEDHFMRTFLMMSVCVVFLIAIFSGGYEENPHKR